jgi:probable rRNA maturation factor
MKVQFFFTDKNVKLADRTRLKNFIASIFKREKKSASSLTYVFCSDEYLLDINKQFLQHDYYTDIITFDLSSTKGVIEGEIYVSVDRVKDNASQQGVTIESELHRVIFHGVLHLCGYKDNKPEDKRMMRAVEDKYLKLYFK